MLGFLKNLLPKSEITTIVPRIRNKAYAAALKKMRVPREEMPTVLPLLGDLFVVYAFDRGEQYEVVQIEDAERLGFDEQTLHGQSVMNVMQRMVSSIGVLTKGDVRRFVTGYHLEACALLIPQLWDLQAQELFGDISVTVPSRDCILFCDADSESAMREMTQYAREEYAQAGVHAISLTQLRWIGDGWHLPGTKKGFLLRAPQQ